MSLTKPEEDLAEALQDDPAFHGLGGSKQNFKQRELSLSFSSGEYSKSQSCLGGPSHRESLGATSEAANSSCPKPSSF